MRSSRRSQCLRPAKSSSPWIQRFLSSGSVMSSRTRRQSGFSPATQICPWPPASFRSRLRSSIPIVSLPGLSTSNLGLSLSPEAVAQIVYTSGTTGRPKGVVHNHHIMLYEATYGSNYFRVGPEDRNLHVFRPVAIAFMKENLKALLAGAALVPFDIKAEGLNRLSDLLRGRRDHHLPISVVDLSCLCRNLVRRMKSFNDCD